MSTELKKQKKTAPSINALEREDEIISDAMELAHQRIKDGTASDSLICQFLKMGSTREQLEKEKLSEEVKLAAAKTTAIESTARIEKLYTDAIRAMQKYSGDDNIRGDYYDPKI